MNSDRPQRYKRAGGTDWPRLLLDLRGAGVPLAEVARLLGRPKPSIVNWSRGCEPRHADGERLLDLWAKKVGEPAEARAEARERVRTGQAPAADRGEAKANCKSV